MTGALYQQVRAYLETVIGQPPGPTRLLRGNEIKLANFANAPHSGRWRASNNSINPVDQLL